MYLIDTDVIGELRQGVEIIRHRKDLQQANDHFAKVGLTVVDPFA